MFVYIFTKKYIFIEIHIWERLNTTFYFPFPYFLCLFSCCIIAISSIAVLLGAFILYKGFRMSQSK